MIERKSHRGARLTSVTHTLPPNMVIMMKEKEFRYYNVKVLNEFFFKVIKRERAKEGKSHSDRGVELNSVTHCLPPSLHSDDDERERVKV